MERRIGLPSKLPNAHCIVDLYFWYCCIYLKKKIKKMLPRYPWRAPGYYFKEMTPTQILCKSRFLSRSDLCHLTRRGECHGCPWFQLGAAPHHPRPWSKLRLLLLCTSLCLRPPGLASPSSAHPRPRLNSTKKEIWRHRSSSVPSRLQRFRRMKWI